jgi:fructose-1-phosphate kinase PfkB-like protein
MLKPLHVPVFLDTSGGAFVAGMAVGVSRGYSFENCIRLATASEAANALNFRTGHVD